MMHFQPLSGFLSLYLLISFTAVFPQTFAETRAAPQILEGKEWQKEVLAPGVESFQGAFADLFNAPQVVSLIRTDLTHPGIRIRFRGTYPRRERLAPLPYLVKSTEAVAAINGGFHLGGHGYSNCGILKIDGQVLPFFKGEIHDFRFAGSVALGIDDNEQLHFRMRPQNGWPSDWPEMQHAMAGGNRLLEEGRLHASIFDRVSVRENLHGSNRHPRSALGVTADQHLILVTIDGRHSGQAHGMTLEELAHFMLALGCVEAINLDGGGASTLWTRGAGVINYPSDNAEFDHAGYRSLRTAILVLSEETESEVLAAGN